MTDRIITKLRAYIEPEQTVLAQFTDENFSHHLYARSIALYRRGELEKALDIMNKLISLMPEDKFFHEFRGDILFSMANPAGAAIAYKKAVSILPESPQIQLNYGRALIAVGTAENYKKAILALEKARKGEPNWAFIYRQLAIAYGRSGQLADADITLAEEALINGETQRAINLARRAVSHKSVSKDTQNRANDILFRYGAKTP